MEIRPVPHTERVKDPDDNFAFAIASLVVSIVGICLVFLPFISFLGIGGCIVGIILGIAALRSRGKLMAIAGIVFSIIGIIIGIANLVLSFRTPAG